MNNPHYRKSNSCNYCKFIVPQEYEGGIYQFVDELGGCSKLYADVHMCYVCDYFEALNDENS